MNQKHLLRFIKKKIKVDGDKIVLLRDGKELTLREVGIHGSISSLINIIDSFYFLLRCLTLLALALTN